MQNQANTELIRFLNGIVESELSFEQDRDVARQLALETTNKVKEYNKLYYTTGNIRNLSNTIQAIRF